MSRRSKTTEPTATFSLYASSPRLWILLCTLLLLLLLAVPTTPSEELSCPNPRLDDGSHNMPDHNNKRTNQKIVLVTGGNGYVASWMVKELLERGYTVHAGVRDANDASKTRHLQELIRDNHQEEDHKNGEETRQLKLFSTGELGTDPLAFDAAMQGGVEAVFHVSIAMDRSNPEHGMFRATLLGTRHLLQAMDRHSVSTLILTSSTAAVPVTSGVLAEESNWLDLQEAKSQGNWYGATKMTQEQMVMKWASDLQHQQQQHQSTSTASNKSVHVVCICPTRVLGPPISTSVPISGWMSFLRKQLREGIEVPNDTIEFVHPHDVARLHIAALEKVLQLSDSFSSSTSERYLCADESWHWKAVAKRLQELHPGMPAVKPYGGQDKLVAPKQYSTEKRKTLGVEFRPMDQILQESVEYLQSQGYLT